MKSKGLMNIEIIIIISSMSLLFSCSSSIRLGRYTAQSSPYSLILFKDGTFRYIFKDYYIFNQSKGNWLKTAKNNLFLNSSIKDKKLILYKENSKYLDSSLIKNYFLTIDVNIPERQKNCYECLLFINDSLYAKRNCDSLNSMKIQKVIKSIFLKLHSYPRMPGRFLDTLTTTKYYLQLPQFESLKLEVAFNDSLFNYKVFDNLSVFYSKKEIQFYDSYKQRTIKLFYTP